MHHACTTNTHSGVVVGTGNTNEPGVRAPIRARPSWQPKKTIANRGVAACTFIHPSIHSVAERRKSSNRGLVSTPRSSRGRRSQRGFSNPIILLPLLLLRWYNPQIIGSKPCHRFITPHASGKGFWWEFRPIAVEATFAYHREHLSLAS